MEHADSEKIRQLSFAQLPAGQAKAALLLLHDLPHLQVLSTIGNSGLLIRYALPYYTLEKIEFALVDQGFHLDQSLFNKLRRALIHYLENLQCQNMTQPEARERSQRIFAQVYEHHAHGDHDDTPLRYSRHILLNEIGLEGQEKLLAAHVLLIGAGGLGSPIALYLAAAGVGQLTLCDHDTVDLTNLQRQIAHQTSALGQNKAESAADAARAINPTIHVTALPQRADDDFLAQQVTQVDLVIDASDNFATRHAINRACVAQRKPLVSGAAVRFDGQVAVFDLRQATAPCYHCLFPETGEADEMRCAENGVFAPLVGIIGCTQAAEAIKLLVGCGASLNGRLLLLNSLDMNWRSVRLKRDPACTVCAGR